MNRVLLTGRPTRDPEMRVVSNGKNATQFSIATNEYRGGAEKAEFHVKGKVHRPASSLRLPTAPARWDLRRPPLSGPADAARAPRRACHPWPGTAARGGNV